MPKLIPVIAACIKTGKAYQYTSAAHAAREGGFELNCVYHCLHGKQKSHGGFTFTPLAPVNHKPKGRIVQVGYFMAKGKAEEQIMTLTGLKKSTVRHLSSHARSLGLNK